MYWSPVWNCCRCVTVFNDTDVSDDDVGNYELSRLSVADDAKRVLSVDACLESSKLSLFTPVVQRRHQYDYHHCYDDRHALDPVQTFRWIRFRYTFT